MKRIGLVIGLLLCASSEGRVEAKKSAPATRSQAMADCRSSLPSGVDCKNELATTVVSGCRCLQLIELAERAFVQGRWHPRDGSFRTKTSNGFTRTYDCGDRAFRRWHKVQCSYLDNIDKDDHFAAVVEATGGAEGRIAAAQEGRSRQVKTQREEMERRERCDKVWSAYVEPVKQEFDSSLERQLYNLPEAAVVPAWALQRVLDETLTAAVNMLKEPASAEDQLGTYFDLLYNLRLARSEKFPAACSEYKFDPGYDEQTKKALGARLAELTAQVNARADEIDREKKLDDAYARKLRAAIKRAGAKADTWYLGLAYSVVEYGMAEVRGHAAFLQDEDESFGLVQALPGGKALFSGAFPFNVMVVGIKTADLMHGTALTDIGLHWVKVLGFVNYTNPVGGQAQAVKVKPLRKIPHPERGEKLK